MILEAKIRRKRLISSHLILSGFDSVDFYPKRERVKYLSEAEMYEGKEVPERSFI